MKCPVKLIKIEKVGKTIITEFCVKFFVRRGSAIEYDNVSVTSSTASQSLNANLKKENRRFSISCFIIYLAGTFNVVILNFIKSSRVLNFAILRRRYFTGFYFRDFKRQIWKRGIKFHN